MRGLLRVLRTSLWLVGPQRRWRWLMLVVLALAVASIEAIGAVLIFTLLQLVSAGDRVVVPVLGDLTTHFPEVDHSTLVVAVAAFVAMFFAVRGLVLVGQAYVQLRMVHNAGAQLSTHLVRGYLALPYLFHTKQNSAELIRNTYDTVMAFAKQVLVPLVKIISQSILLVGLVGVLLWTSLTATLIAIGVFVPLIWLLMRIIHPKLDDLGERSQSAKHGTLKAIQQALGGVREVKILGRERFFTGIYADERSNLARVSYVRGALAEIPRALIETALVSTIVLMFVVAVVAGDPVEGLLSTIGVFGYVGLRLQPSLRDIVAGVNDLKFSRAVLGDLTEDRRRVDQALERRRTWLAAGSKEGQFSNRIELEGVRFSYSRESAPALTGIDLTVRRGEFVGICGPTGGGKSTMVDLIAGLLTPTEGRVLIDGADLAEMTPWWYQQLGVVSQSIFLIDDTMRSNIALGRDFDEIDEDRVRRAVRRAQLDSVVSELPDGLDTIVGERGIRLSGGQRQRVAIARAFYREPAVLILDEGTSALDMATEAALVAAIDELKEGRTLIAVAHRISTVQRADRIVVVEGGRIAAVGTYDELFQRSDLFRTLAQ